MKQNLSLVAISAVCVVMLSACRNDPTGANNGLSSNEVTSPAHPALTYYGAFKRPDTTYPAIYVMDADTKNQAAIYIGPSCPVTFGTPSWSPDGRSICFTQDDPQTGLYSIHAVDVSFNTTGLSLNTNARTVLGISDPTVTLHNSHWSSTAAMGKIAYTMDRNTLRGSPTTSLCVVSQTGGAPTVVWTGSVTYGMGYCTWSPDDSRLAVMRQDDQYDATIMIFNTANWSYVDSIPVTGRIIGLEWSRSGLNKLAFGMSTENLSPFYLYYCDPITGAIPTTDGVVGYSPTWSPNNSTILFYNDNGLSKVTPFTPSSAVIAPLFGSNVAWKR